MSVDITTWFQTTSWFANWATFFDTLSLELFIAWMIYRFLGGMTGKEARVFKWRMRGFASLSAADKAKLRIEMEDDQ